MSLIANTENLDSVFSFVYSKENYIKDSESYKYYVGNIDSKIRCYESDINHMKSPITKILICDSIFMKRKNERKFYLIVTDGNAKDNCLKSVLFNSLPYAFVIWPLSLILYVSFILLVMKYSPISITFEPLNILYLFLMSLFVVLVMFIVIYILLDNLRITHDKTMRIKENKEKEWF